MLVCKTLLVMHLIRRQRPIEYVDTCFNMVSTFYLEYQVIVNEMENDSVLTPSLMCFPRDLHTI